MVSDIALFPYGVRMCGERIASLARFKPRADQALEDGFPDITWKLELSEFVSGVLQKVCMPEFGWPASGASRSARSRSARSRSARSRSARSRITLPSSRCIWIFGGIKEIVREIVQASSLRVFVAKCFEMCIEAVPGDRVFMVSKAAPLGGYLNT